MNKSFTSKYTKPYVSPDSYVRWKQNGNINEFKSKEFKDAVGEVVKISDASGQEWEMVISE